MLMIIPDTEYLDASQAVAGRKYSGGDVEDDPARYAPTMIEKVLRAYVSLGCNRKIQDFSNSGTVAEKTAISEAVAAECGRANSYRPAVRTVMFELIVLLQLADQGLVAPQIARPRLWQDRLDGYISQAPEIKNIAERAGDALAFITRPENLKYVGLAVGAVLLISLVNAIRPPRS